MWIMSFVFCIFILCILAIGIFSFIAFNFFWGGGVTSAIRLHEFELWHRCKQNVRMHYFTCILWGTKLRYICIMIIFDNKKMDITLLFTSGLPTVKWSYAVLGGFWGVFLCKTFPKFRYLLHICKEYEVDKIQGYKITIKSKNQFPI